MNFGSGPRCYRCCICRETIPVMAEKFIVEKHPGKRLICLMVGLLLPYAKPVSCRMWSQFKGSGIEIGYLQIRPSPMKFI